MLPLQRVAFNNAAEWKGGDGVWSATDKSDPAFKVGDGNHFNAWASNPNPGGTEVTFAYASGTVSCEGGVTVGTITLDQTGFVFTGALALAGAATLDVIWAGQSATFSANLTCAGSLTKTGNGDAIITGNATIPGDIHVGSGTLRFDNAKTNYPNDITAGGTVEFANPADLYLTGAIDGSGVIRKIGPGYLFVNGANAGARDFVYPVGFAGTFDVPVLNRPPVFSGAAPVVICRAGTLRHIPYLVTDPDGDAISSVSAGGTANGSVTNVHLDGCDYTAANGSSNQAIALSATDSLGATGNAAVTAWNFSSSAIFVDTDGATGSYSATSDVVVVAVVPGRATKWSATLTGANTFNFLNPVIIGQGGSGVALSGTCSGFTGTFQVGSPAVSAPTGCYYSAAFYLGDPTAGVGANTFASTTGTFVGVSGNQAQVFVRNMTGGSLTQAFKLGAYAIAYFDAGAYTWNGSFTGSYGDFASSSTTSYLRISPGTSVALGTAIAAVLCEWSVDSPTSAIAGTCTLPASPNLANFKFIARSSGSDTGGTFTTTVFSWTGTATGMPVIYHAGFNIATPTLSGGKYYYALQSSANPALALTGVLDLTAGTFSLVRAS